MTASDQLPSGALRVRVGPTGNVFYEGKWRLGGRQRIKRIGPAWLERDGDGLRPRRGRPQPGTYTEKTAVIRMAELIRDDADSLAAEEAQRNALPTFRVVAHEWLDWVEHVRGARGGTLRDYRSSLAEPGTPHKTGRGTCEGRIMAALGDKPIDTITVRQISALLREFDKTGVSTRTVNKKRQVLSSIFNYARREDTYQLARNPVSATDKRREPPAAALDFFEPHEIETLARTFSDGAHRAPAYGRGGGVMDLGDDEIAARCDEDAQDAEMLRVLAYTGVRVGEAVGLKWSDVDFDHHRLIVQRSVSGDVEGPTKSWQVRYVPLAEPAHQALRRLAVRADFTSRDDYVFVNRLGRRVEPSAYRRRFHRARQAAGLRHMKLHGLRHGAGSLIARETDAVFVQHFLGHAKLATTERYMHAKARHEDIERINRAFARSQDRTAG